MSNRCQQSCERHILLILTHSILCRSWWLTIERVMRLSFYVIFCKDDFFWNKCTHLGRHWARQGQVDYIVRQGKLSYSEMDKLMTLQMLQAMRVSYSDLISQQLSGASNLPGGAVFTREKPDTYCNTKYFWKYSFYSYVTPLIVCLWDVGCFLRSEKLSPRK